MKKRRRKKRAGNQVSAVVMYVKVNCINACIASDHSIKKYTLIRAFERNSNCACMSHICSEC